MIKFKNNRLRRPVRTRLVVMVFIGLLLVGFGATANVSATTVRYYAVIIGINDYSQSPGYNNLLYSNNDANDWYWFLTYTIGFDTIRVLGDDTSYYHSYYALATKSNILSSLNWLVNIANSHDQIAVILSGHGDATIGTTDSWFVTFEGGQLHDYELASILAIAVASAIFVFLDSCHSGGFLDDLAGMGNSIRVFATSACRHDGFTAQDSLLQNSMWTYHYLEEWFQFTKKTKPPFRPNPAQEVVFDHAYISFSEWVDQFFSWPIEGYPQKFDGNPNRRFVLGPQEL